LGPPATGRAIVFLLRPAAHRRIAHLEAEAVGAVDREAIAQAVDDRRRGVGETRVEHAADDPEALGIGDAHAWGHSRFDQQAGCILDGNQQTSLLHELAQMFESGESQAGPLIVGGGDSCRDSASPASFSRASARPTLASR